jgi:peptidoglycan/xylan/chitin deacetylase (PgdA/CDA1 family)
VRPKRFAKALLGQALVRGGLWQRRLRTWARRNAVIILTYHRVTEKWDETLDYSQPGMVVTVAGFERQLAILMEHFDIVTLSALLRDDDRTSQRARPRCVITFDDGWRDNYDLALPILRRHDLPATIYLSTDFIGTDRAFWHTELIYLFTQTDVSRSLGNEPAFRRYPDPVRHELRRLATIRPLVARDLDPLIETVKTLCDEEAIDDLVQALAQTVGLRRPLVQGRRFFLDWEQVRAMAAAGFAIGSHGCSHRILTRLPAEAAREELVRSKAEIERRVGVNVEHFAFPNNAGSEALVTAAATAGYRTACLGEPVTRGRALGIQPLLRLGIHEGIWGDGQSFDESLLRYWLFRAPEAVPA